MQFLKDMNVFPEESLHRAMLGLRLPTAIDLTRNDLSEQDLDTFIEGMQNLRTDKRELGHR